MTPLDRRAFVGAALAGAAGFAAGRAHARPAPRGEPNNPSDRPKPAGGVRLALKVGMIHAGDDLPEKLAIAAKAGFEGVELDSPGPYDAAEVRAAVESSGVAVHGVVLSTHWNKPFNHPDAAVRREAAAALDTAMADCAAFGGSTVLVVPAVVNESMPYADAYRRSQEAMHAAADRADALGVSIAFENVWNNFLLSPLEAARYCDELNEGRARRTFGWYMDLGNVVNSGWPEQWIDTLGPRILKLDVKDFSRRRRDEEGLWKGFGVEIGDGDVGWNRVRDALAGIGYAGWATAEVAGGGPERLADLARRMAQVFSVR